MKRIRTLLLFLAFCQDLQAHEFPPDFVFGVSTASYQIEGAWNESGKGVNIWDHLTHTQPNFVLDQSNGDVACDAYHKTKEDVKLLKELGVDFYRFSLSWSRILPSGFINEINPDGIRYYNELIDELLKNDIKPFVTLYHWDLPQQLSEIGGWPNPLLSDIFVEYANLVFEKFGDRVKHWVTFNEPVLVCREGYDVSQRAPGYKADGIGGYLCSKTLLVAHGKTYKLYNEKYRERQKGKVGITLDSSWFEPKTESVEDKEAAQRGMQMTLGWFAHPILSKTGDYPQVMKDRVSAKSQLQGFPNSRLPDLTPDEITLIKGTYDFLGINHYTTGLISDKPQDVKSPSTFGDIDMERTVDPSWEPTVADWFYVVPWGIRKLMNWIKDEYGNPSVIITESGYVDGMLDGIDDCRRVSYYNRYLEQLLLAIHEDGCNVVGYTAWSFMDNFEWDYGYTQRFGLVHIDFGSADRTRTPKRSYYSFRNIIKSRKINWDFNSGDFPKCVW